MRTRNEKGFTLIELMIVVVIIGILAAIAIPRFQNVSKSAKQSEAGPVLKQICNLANARFQQRDTWPSALTAAELPGYEAPNAKYFDFDVAGTPTVVTASPNTAGTAAGLETATMNCATGAVTP